MLAFQKDGDSFRLVARQWLPERRSVLFGFFSEAANLSKLTPSWVRFRILSPEPIVMRAGTLIDYRISVFGVPMTWKTEITVWEPETRFVDLQLEGPYSHWEHEHRFEEENGGTRITDTVVYRVPIASIVHPLFVRGALRKIFGHRQRVMAELWPAR